MSSSCGCLAWVRNDIDRGSDLEPPHDGANHRQLSALAGGKVARLPYFPDTLFFDGEKPPALRQILRLQQAHWSGEIPLVTHSHVRINTVRLLRVSEKIAARD